MIVKEKIVRTVELDSDETPRDFANLILDYFSEDPEEVEKIVEVIMALMESFGDFSFDRKLFRSYLLHTRGDLNADAAIYLESFLNHLT